MKVFIRTIAVVSYIPLGYVVYTYFTEFVPKQGIVDDMVCGVLILSLLLVPILMWKDAEKL
ncbi:hypothetical protein [Bacillus sp. FDAARGOS_1420]|uniref:hypothetical protein n=1 Tax=Bacillus sp. FDAARGOS_1420 TaxID=2856338 RepID=UPI001C5AEAD1|nr:hypothetical protein [Bacillus sp. FDAARGOS_1420]MBW3491150.1 hypothetical protein [Bacillus sp. FDAARGOS_1420]